MPERRSYEGEANPNARLSAAQVRAIRADTRPIPEIAAAYRVTVPHIFNIIARRVWAHLAQ